MYAGIKLHIIGTQTKHDASEVAVDCWDTWIYATVYVYSVCIWVLAFTFSTTLQRTAKLSSSSHMRYTESAALLRTYTRVSTGTATGQCTHSTHSLCAGRWLLPYMAVYSTCITLYLYIPSITQTIRVLK